MAIISMTPSLSEAAEFIRLMLISGVIDIDKAHTMIESIIAEEVNTHLIEAACAYDAQDISTSLSELGNSSRDCLVECMIVRYMLRLFDTNQTDLRSLASALYLQYVDPRSQCWSNDTSKIMSFDDGFNLAEQGIVEEASVASNLLSYLKEKASLCRVDSQLMHI